jgi:transcriptional regulator with XRE-family HTH domain
MDFPARKSARGIEISAEMDHDGRMTWREKLQKHRQQLRLSQAELAATIGLQQSRIGRWEVGEGMPSMEQGHKLALALNVPYDYLMDDTQAEPPLPALSPDEAMVLEMARTLGMAEAKRRLLAAPAIAPPAPATDHGRVLAEQDLTASTRSRIREARRARPSRKSKPNPKSQDEGTDPTGSPHRRR